MSWRLAKSLDQLRAQANKAYPNRSKASDGTIGDAAHSSRASDHNPHVKDSGMGVVTALDLTHDPKGGLDIQALADALVTSKDERIKYIICNGRIVSGSGQKSPAWKWRPYTGKNAHSRHIHVSVKAAKASYDDTRAWAMPGYAKPVPVPKPKDSILKRGSSGPFVKELQTNLAALGFAAGSADGVFGERTEQAVISFQKAKGMKPDGWAGPRTIEAIGKALAEKASGPKLAAVQEQVQEAAQQEVEEKTSFWQWLTGMMGSGAIGLGWLAGMDWQAVVAGGAVLVVMIVILLLLRRHIVAAVKDIRNEVG